MREIRIGPATKIDLLDPVGDDVTGRWVLSADGIVYRPKYVPFGVAATYTAQRAETALDLSSWKRWMPLCTSIAASCAVFCEHSQLGDPPMFGYFRPHHLRNGVIRAADFT